MSRSRLEIADIFRAHGPAWRRTNAGHVSLTQLKVMSAIEACRTQALGGHVAGCAKCGHQHVAYAASWSKATQEASAAAYGECQVFCV